MRHQIPLERWQQRLGPELAPRLGGMSEAIERCVHCGFCLATCPTYRVMGEEMDSPRGRIFLIKEMLEERLTLDEVLEHIDPCLGCLACETSCPSGVEYRNLLQPMRTYGERERHRPLIDRLRRASLLEVMARPAWFRTALRLGKVAAVARRWLPDRWRAPLDLVPEQLPQAGARLPAVTPAQGKRRARVALLSGCVQQVLDPELSAAALDVLSRNGVEVLIPPGQGCCGALALHVGDERRARRMARRNLDAFCADLEVDALLTCAAGCGSGVRESSVLFAGTDAERAGWMAGKSRDVTAFLADLGLSEAPPPLTAPLRVVVQDPCHLLHAQRERKSARTLLAQIGGVELLEPRDAEVCCGSAGLYSLEWPQVAAELGRNKAAALRETRPHLVASANIGCSVQVERWLREGAADAPQDLPAPSRRPAVLHPIQILQEAYHGQLARHRDGF